MHNMGRFVLTREIWEIANLLGDISDDLMTDHNNLSSAVSFISQQEPPTKRLF